VIVVGLFDDDDCSVSPCAFVEDYGVSFMETSAKTALNVENAFMSVARSFVIVVMLST